MSIESNKAVIQRFCQVWAKGDPTILDELAAPGIHVFYPMMPEPIEGVDAFKAVVARFRTSFPDIKCEVEELIGEGDVVVEHWRVHGTHLGDLMGIPPSGKKVSWGGITIYHLKQGKVVDERGEEDGLGLFRQIGALPESSSRS